MSVFPDVVRIHYRQFPHFSTPEIWKRIISVHGIKRSYIVKTYLQKMKIIKMTRDLFLNQNAKLTWAL